MREKQREYARTAEKYETMLAKAGVASGSDVTHERLLDAKKKLDGLESALQPLKAKLEGYQELPADLTLAKAKVAEARAELETLSRHLTRDISMLHI